MITDISGISKGTRTSNYSMVKVLWYLCCRVVSLDMSPVNDTFISAAVDDSVRLWDLRSNNCSGLVHVKGYPSVAIDHRGLVFAVGLENNSVRLYDIRNFEKVILSWCALF
jgi:WD40 repeat protein